MQYYNKAESILTLTQVSRILDIPEEIVNLWIESGLINCCANTSAGDKLFRLRDIAHLLNALKTTGHTESNAD